jgi:hypothetical protein
MQTSIWCPSQKWWSYTFTPSYVFPAWRLINKAQDQFYFYLAVRQKEDPELNGCKRYQNCVGP